MSENKVELLKDIAPTIAQYLPIKKHAHALSVSKHFNKIFTPSFLVRKALTFIVEGNINGCDLLQQYYKPTVRDCKNIKRNQYIFANKSLFYFHCKTKELIELPMLEGKSFIILKEILNIEKIRVANRKDQKLITDFTGHVYEDRLIDLIENDPSLLFKTYPVIEAFGQKYYDYSPYLLMAFLREKDMLTTTMSLDKIKSAIKNNKHLQMLLADQYQQILGGGTDFVKIDFEPREIAFEKLLQHEQTFTLTDETQQTFTFPLLENEDGIFCYHRIENEQHIFSFFYVKKNKTIKPLDDRFIADQSAFEKLKKSIIAMEYNTSRRLSEEEYHFIKQAFNISLVHKGLFYENDGLLFRDTCAPFFNLENGYRKYLRLFEEARHNSKWAIVDKTWQDDVGSEQFKIAWVWQRFCEEGKPFYPLAPKLFDDFRRSAWVFNYGTRLDSLVAAAGIINLAGLGLIKPEARPRAWPAGWRPGGLADDLVAIHWLIKDAKAGVLEFNQVQELQRDYTISECDSEIGGLNLS